MVEGFDVAYVVEKLSKFVEPDNIMLIGARCRNIHQWKYRDRAASRTTDDIDFALAIESWDDFVAVKEALPSLRKCGRGSTSMDSRSTWCHSGRSKPAR